MLPRTIGLVDDFWSMRFDPLTVSSSIRSFILVCKMIVVLSSVSQDGQVNLYKAERTSSCSGVICLYSALASFAKPPKLVLAAALSACNFSVMNTPQAVETALIGGLRAVSLSCFLIRSDFCLSVSLGLGLVLGLGLGLAFAFLFFPGFGLGLIRGFAFDLAFGTAFGVVFLGAGFLAAFVFEVVGAFLAAVVVLPVWAFGRDTALCA